MRAEAAYWLALLHTSGLKLSVLKPIVQQWYLMEGRPLAELFNRSATELSVHFNISSADAEKIIRAANNHAAQLRRIDRWHAQGITVLPLSHPQFPTRLLNTLPPQRQPLLLWAKGNLKLLVEPMVTVLGDPETEAAEIDGLKSLIAELSAEGIGVVSGYGKGLDRIAFETALELPKGQSVAILPLGLNAFSQLTQKLDAPVAAGKTVLVSPFEPDTEYKEAFSAARNLLVDSLAMVLLVPGVDSLAKERAIAALERGMPVLVGNTDTPANRELIAAGAFLMTDPGEVIELVQQAIIDTAIQSQLAQKPAVEPLPPGKMLNETDDFALHADAVNPLPPDETLDILSSAGNVPSSLREKLMALEKEANERKGE